MKKRILAVLICVLLTLSSIPAVYATETESTDATDTAAYVEKIVWGEGDDAETFLFVEAASNDNFVLAYDEATTFISLTDKRTGQVWYSNPPISINADPYVQGIAKTDIRSVLHLTYTNSSLKVKETNSYSGSVMKEAFTVKVLDDGLRVDYEFEEAKITIPVQYTLTEDGMIAEILFSEMKEDSTNVINNMDFLMYFGTAGEEDDGYLVVPDGSGAIINFNNQKNQDSLMYSKPVYGDDMSEITELATYTSREEKINLPMYGMVKNGYGFVAEITSGASIASIEAATSGNRLVGAYNTVYTNATYRVNYSLPLLGQVSSETSNAMYNAQDATTCETYTVQFHFSDNNNTTYMTLANTYRNLMIERGWLEKDTITDKFYTEFYGGVPKTKSFLGIVYKARQTLTSFEEAQDILQDLADGGVDAISAQYVNFSNDFFSRDMEVGLKPSNSLGGKTDMASLLSFTQNSGTTLAVAADFVTLPTSSYGYSTYNDVANAINISPIQVYPFSLNANTFNTSKKPYYLVDAKMYADAVKTLMKSVSKYGYGALYFDDDAVQLYSDLAPDGYQSERTIDAQREQMAILGESGTELTLSNPNAYLYEYADYLVNIPVCSSKELLFDEDIPFLQAVLRGVKNFSGESMNITDVSDESFLRHLEYGTNIKYTLIEADSEALLNTDYTYLYSATYEIFADQIKERYQVIKEFGAAVEDATMTDHSRENGVAITTYSNGTKVYINYNDEAVTVDGVTVEGMSYAFV